MIVQKSSCLGLKYSTKDTASSIRKMMSNYRTNTTPLLEPSLEMKVESNRNEQAILERWNLQEETFFDVSKEETSSTFQNIFLLRFRHEPTLQDDSGRQLLSSTVVSNDTVHHYTFPTTSDCDSEMMPGLTHRPHQGSEEQVVPSISSTADGNSSEFSPTGSRAKMLVNLFLREISAWSEPPPRVRLSSESDFDEELFAELKGKSNGKRCFGKGRASFKRLRVSSDLEYLKRKREFEARNKHNSEERFQGIASLDDTTRQLLEVDIVKPLSLFRQTSGE